ncbi:MAG: hemerythrin domain-containing protein [bacterium]
MDLLQAIQKDHEELKGILEKLKKTTNGGSKQREDLFAKLKKEITPHMEAEEKAYYPVLKEKKGAREKVLESVEEHHVTKTVLKELEKLSRADEQWPAKLSVFKELVEHHIEEEEDSIFELTRELMEEEQLEEVLASFTEQKEKVRSKMA